MPIQGLQFVIPTNTERHQAFQATASFVVYNPNDGVCFVSLDRTATALMWDHKVPSQSGGKFPGPINSYLSIFYQDQSGSGQNGQVIIYPSMDVVDIPYFWSIGRALLSTATALDIVEGSQPGNPGSGILRLWADGSDQLHGLNGGGTDEVFISTRTALGGGLSGFLPNPSLSVPWQTWSPVVSQSVGLTLSGVTAYYRQIDKLTEVIAEFTIASAGTSGQAFNMTLPVTAQLINNMPVGNFFYLRNGVNFNSGIATLASASVVQFWLGGTVSDVFGKAPTAFAAANGDTLGVWLAYRTP